MRETIKRVIDTLAQFHNLSDEDLLFLLSTDLQADESAHLYKCADNCRRQIYGTDIYIRGLIEFTSYCKNDCYYCGIRKSNTMCKRYRLTKASILSCCEQGYSLGFRTFVLQGGEDGYFTDDVLCDIVASLRSRYRDCAITLSVGERSYDSYKALFAAGANRYLLRHETATKSHYNKLHPSILSLENRIKCLYNLKSIGYQVGAGFMVGSPYQTTNNLLADLRFLQELAPDMIGIGPFIRHADTPFFDKTNGTLEMALRLISILRLLFPNVLLPATTALGTIHKDGRWLGIKAGANVLMPNLSPVAVRESYSLYDNKLCTNEESAANLHVLSAHIKNIGYEIVTDIGNKRQQ